jgi:hypothetical protein
MRAFLRKLSVLMVLFSGMFILLGEVIAPVFRVQLGSLMYCFLQAVGFFLLVVLLAVKKLHVF